MVAWLEEVAGLEHKDLVGEVVVEADISHGWCGEREREIWIDRCERYH